MKNKFQIENMLSTVAEEFRILKLYDINELENLEGFYIYMIGSRPRITLDSSKILINSQTVSLTFIFNDIDHKSSEKNITVPNNIGISEIILSHSNSRIICLNQAGDTVLETTVSILYMKLIVINNLEYDENLNLKVLYVGQSNPKDKSKNIKNRLQNHSTFQKIYSHIQEEKPSDDLFIILFKYGTPTIMSMMGGGISNNASIGLEESIKNYSNCTEASIPTDQNITLNEAMLISYFKPKYNEEYKDTFLKENHSSYDFIYKMDYSHLFSNIDLTNIQTKLYSDEHKASFMHQIQFHAHSKEGWSDFLSSLLKN